MGKGGTQINDWCDARDWVPDNKRIYRCSKCGKRLHPREQYCAGGEFVGYRLREHKKKGHKIKKAKARKLKNK